MSLPLTSPIKSLMMVALVAAFLMALVNIRKTRINRCMKVAQEKQMSCGQNTVQKNILRSIYNVVL